MLPTVITYDLDTFPRVIENHKMFAILNTRIVAAIYIGWREKFPSEPVLSIIRQLKITDNLPKTWFDNVFATKIVIDVIDSKFSFFIRAQKIDNVHCDCSLFGVYLHLLINKWAFQNLAWLKVRLWID